MKLMTLSEQSPKSLQQGFDVYMMTPDKDYGQLVEENIKMYKPKSFGTGFDVIDK